jgi:carbamoyltransferase
MLILGVNGGLDPVHESRYALSSDYVHDAAAVLLDDGRVVAGIEQERIDRIKHSNKNCLQSVRACLACHSVGLDDVDHIAIYVSEAFFDASLRDLHLNRPELGPTPTTRALYQRLFEQEFGVNMPAERFCFVNHHLCHAFSAYGASGFDEALVLAADGAGEDVSTMVFDARGRAMEVLRVKPMSDSLGFFYLDVIRFLGYRIYDEYKVMALASYGDPSVHRERFRKFFSLGDEGDYTLYRERVMSLYDVTAPRQRGEPFVQVHYDIAAAVQEAVEIIVLHVLKHYRESTGHRRLCIAGGVGQNSSMNGRIVASGLFSDVYVPPAAADSGCALGAALAVANEVEPERPLQRIEHAFWGTELGDDRAVERELGAWSTFVSHRRMTSTFEEVAALVAGGAVIGWVQGRSEFGPRALGSRSIIADPRPASHKHLINAMVKKREGYRPFAPSVLEERVADYFVLPNGQLSYPFMSFVLEVRPEVREHLGAITHVDGTARLQTVCRATNPRYWSLIAAFEALTGVPIVLNTSFNNHVEPIVDSLTDAIVCFLTTGLDYLVAGDYLVEKRKWTASDLAQLVPSIPRAARLTEERLAAADARLEPHYSLSWNYAPDKRRTISRATHEFLCEADGRTPGDAIVRGASAAVDSICEELLELWGERFVVLSPAAIGHD